MKSSSSRNPISSFAIPPHAPPDVAKACADFDRLADLWVETGFEIEAARESQKVVVAEARRTLVDAEVAGKTSKVDPVAVAAGHAAIVDDLVARREARATALDELGNELSRTISQNKSEWIEALETQREEAAARYERALADVRSALAAFAPMRRAVEWVAGFEHGPATVGLVPGFAGGQIRVRDAEFVRGPHSEPQDPFRLLDILATATTPTEAAKPRTHTIALESSMS
jgi:hypothetical protein